MDIHDIQIQVKDVYRNNKWNLEIFYTNLINDIKEEIISAPIPDQSELEDTLIQDNQANGIDTARASYKWRQHQHMA